jgi:hypothetical protein
MPSPSSWWSSSSVHVLGDRVNIRTKLDGMKRFDSEVILLTCLPAA